MLNLYKLNEKIEEYYTSLRDERDNLQAYYQNKLNSNSEYVLLKNKIGETTFNIAKANYTNDKTLVESLESDLENLNNKMSILLDKIGNFNKYSKNNYACNLCKDTGYVNNKRCKCYYKLLTKFALQSLGVSEREFNKISHPTISPLEKHYDLANKFISKFPSSQIKNFVFLGQVGTGKSYLASAICGELQTKGFLPIYLTSTELNNLFLKMHSSIVDKDLAFSILIGADILVIDDLGTEPLYNNVTREYLLALISERIDKNRHFIITTNLTTEEMLNRYNERLISRLSDKNKTKFIPFNGKDLRFNSK